MSKNNIAIVKDDLDYDYNFDHDIINFLNGDVFKVKGVTKKWNILTNFHGTVELNVTPQFIPGRRTISWATPFEYSRFLFSTLSDSHNYSALLLDWATKSGISAQEHHHYRDQVTFLLIPPKKEMTFLIGFAAPQDSRDKRGGGEVQLRFKNVPAGTITVQVPLKLKKSNTMEGGKESKVYDLEEAYETAMNDLESYIDNLPIEDQNALSIPQSVFMQEPKMYTTVAEDLTMEDLEGCDMHYLEEIIQKFNILGYAADYWNTIDMQEIEVTNKAA